MLSQCSEMFDMFIHFMRIFERWRFIEYYLDNRFEFEKVRVELSVGGIDYPAMKLMDMCMWQIGFENDSKLSKVSGRKSKRKH